ncbi:MAG: response regulator transcription factor [Chloroflexi bacterium]|nr:response regulator transcription factor [Chloroflexota bacterium]
MTTILLIAHHDPLRQSLRDWLAIDLPQCHVIEATDMTAAIDLAQNTTLHIIIIDTDIPQENDFEALRRIHTSAPDVQIVAFGLDETEVRRASIIEAGATAYLPKSRVQTDLIPTLQAAFGTVKDKHVSRTTNKECRE